MQDEEHVTRDRNSSLHPLLSLRSVAYVAIQCGILSINMIPPHMQRSTLQAGLMEPKRRDTQEWVAYPGDFPSINQ
jgi:hypothetical protein